MNPDADRLHSLQSSYEEAEEQPRWCHKHTFPQKMQRTGFEWSCPECSFEPDPDYDQP